MNLYIMKLVYVDGHSVETCIDVRLPMTPDRLADLQKREPDIKDCYLLKTTKPMLTRFTIPVSRWRPLPK